MGKGPWGVSCVERLPSMGKSFFIVVGNVLSLWEICVLCREVVFLSESNLYSGGLYIEWWWALIWNLLSCVARRLQGGALQEVWVTLLCWGLWGQVLQLLKRKERTKPPSSLLLTILDNKPTLFIPLPPAKLLQQVVLFQSITQTNSLPHWLSTCGYMLFHEYA